MEMLRDLVLGATSGLTASAAVVPVDHFLGKFITESQRRQEQQVRQDSPHHIAGEVFAKRLLDRQLTEREKKLAQITFSVTYGIVWGIIYRVVRRSLPQSKALAGLPYSVGFYLLCDGVLAPMLRLTPSVHKLPWQFNAREVVNHTAWTATAEGINRYFDARAS